jgi:GNAT superfamily N-acetyltransferase
MRKIAPLFSGWNETFIWSCLQGHMGYAVADDEDNPTAAQIVVGDICFFAGVPNAGLAARASAPIIVPQNEEWEAVIARIWKDRADKALRYATVKNPAYFNIEKLSAYADSLGNGYILRTIDEELYHQAIRESWSKDLCSLFKSSRDFSERGIGIAVIHEGQLVAGASSYFVYSGGIEIEIDTKPEYRRKGLATACGSKLILECLKRGLYPSWDAYDLRSAALAEKLGYQIDRPYVVFIKK